MYRKIVWFYFSALILLEFSLQSMLSAHENSDDAVTHDSLVSEELAIEECASCAGAEWVRLAPAALRLGRAGVGAARAARVTLHNRADSTLHLASVAGTTPDFHASFFHSKAIPAGGNTSFSVVFVARGEGPAAADLFLHTSRGLHKYPVSAWGEPSAWCVRAAGGLRVAHNHTTRVPLELCNPTERPLQIVEAFSSAAWCGVEVGGSWTLGSHSQPPSPPLVLSLRHHYDPHTAYLRIKFNDSSVGSLTVRVDVTPTRGVTLPSHIDLGTRGSEDEPHVEVLSGGNPTGSSVRVEPRVCGPPACGPDAPHAHHGAAAAGGEAAGAEEQAAGGVALRALADSVAPHAAARPLAEIHFDWRAVWAAALAGGADPGSILRCSGLVRLAAQRVHYSVRLLAGTFRTQPLHARLSGEEGEGGGAAEGEGEGAGAGQLTATNTFSFPLHVLNVVYPEDAHLHFTTSEFSAAVVGAGERWRGPRVAPRAGAGARGAAGRREPPPYGARVTLLTNVSRYAVPLALYSPALLWEFDWLGYSEGVMDAGGVPAGGTKRIQGFLATAAPADQLILDVTTDPPDLKLIFQQPELVVWARSRVPVTLEIPCPARAGAVSGAVTVRTRHVTVTLKLSYSRVDEDLRLHDIHLQGRYGAVTVSGAGGAGPLAVRGLGVRGDLPYSLRYTATCQSASGELQTVTFPVATSRAGAGAAPCRAVGPLTLSYLHNSALEETCECGSEPESALEKDADRVWARAAAPARLYNFTLHVYTSQLLQVSASGRASPDWTHLASPLPDLGAAALGQAVSTTIRVSNPSAAWPLWLQPVIGRYHSLPDLAFSSAVPAAAARAAGAADGGAFSVAVAAGAAGAAGAGAGGGACGRAAGGGGAVLVPPGGAALLNVTFAPARLGDHHAVLYLRNNVSGVEAAWARGRGVAARVALRGSGELRARPACRPAATEVVAVATGGAGVGAGVALVAGAPCAARGFSVSPCPHPPLQPDQVLVLAVEYAGEWSVAEARATLQVPHAAPLELRARGGAARAARCAPPAARAALPREPALLLAVLAAAAALTAAACQAEAVLKRAVATMRTRDPPPAPHLPPPHLLDLRALARTTLHAHTAPAAPAPAPPPPPHAHSAAHALTATASSLARHKRKVKKILAEIKSDLAKSRPPRRRASPDYRDDLDAQLLEDDLSRSSNEESVDTNADEPDDDADFRRKFDNPREKFDDFDSQYKYATSHDRPAQSGKQSSQHKSEAAPHKAGSGSGEAGAGREEKARGAGAVGGGPAPAAPRAPCSPRPRPRPRPADDSTSESGSDRDRPLADSPPPRDYKREGASEIASSTNSSIRRRDRVSKRDSNTPPRPHERQRHVRPKARVVARRRSPPLPPADSPLSPADPPASPTDFPAEPPAPPALRATFSEVVSCGAPAPARAAPPSPPPARPPPAPAHARTETHDSLFYYSATRGGSWGGSSPLSAGAPLAPLSSLSPLSPGAPLGPLAPLSSLAQPAPVAPPAPQPLRSDIFTHAQDRHSAYNDSSVGAGAVGGGGGGGGGGAGWRGAGWRAVRPPPGFPLAAPPPAPPAARAPPPEAAARTFDPLNALAGVWEGGAWRDPSRPHH